MLIYSGMVITLQTMFGHLLGDLDFSTMNEINGNIGTIYYFIFTSVMTFIVMNFFFTILGDGFAQTQEQIRQLHNQYEILEFLRRLIYDVLGIEREREIIDIYKEDEDMHEDQENVEKVADMEELK